MSDPAPEPATGTTPLGRLGALPRAGRVLVYVAALVVLALVAGLAFAAVVVRRPLPETSAEVVVPGLSAEVRVLRDGHGIPHVYAASAHDLFYAQGYVQAQDRFFQMDVRRHATAGRLAELLGEPALDSDKLVRVMGWRRVAEEEVSLLDPETYAYLQAYSEGVNAYIDSHDPEEMALEYTVLDLAGLDYAVEEWTPADSLAWLKAMAWDLRGNMQDEITRAIASARISPERIAELYPPYPYDRHRPVVESGPGGPRPEARSAADPAAVTALAELGSSLAAMPAFLGRGDSLGSNAWAVSGDRSATGAPILANDPHLGTSLPGPWYQMGLHCTEPSDRCPFDVSGFTFAGLPGVVIGHNRDIAWGFTNLEADVADLYLEKITGRSALRGNRLEPLATREETIEVRGRDEPFTFTVRSTRHGPLLSDVSAELSTVGANSPVGPEAPERGVGYGVALAWTALQPRPTVEALFALNRARDWADFRSAARRFAVPAQNMVYADREGHIGYQVPGVVPIRRAGNDGRYPAEGWRRSDDWTGRTVPFEALPSVLDPEEGYVVTANQAVAGPDYRYYLGDSWAPGYRSQRIVELIERGGRLDVADMNRIQTDARNGFAPTFVPYLLDVLMPSEYLAAGQRLLQGWDYRQGAGSPAAAYYNAVWERTLALTFHDELREPLWPGGGGRWFEVMRRLLERPEDVWWDDVTTETVVETRDVILQRAMAEARDELVRRQARRAVDWTWGHHHRMDLEHQTLGRSEVGLLRWLFNRDGYQVGGGAEIVNATAWDAASGSFAVTDAPSMRMVVSLADPDDSTWVNLTGASGHPFGPHYVDQTEEWVAGRTLPWPSSRDAVGAAAEDVLVLRPEP